MPETLFFENGRPIWLAYTEKDGYLTKINYATQKEANMSNTKPLHRYIQEATVTRKANTRQYWM